MKPLWTTPLIFLLPAGLAFGQQPASKQESSFCRLDSLPTAIQHRLKQEYGSWRVQEVANLSQRAHGRWESEKPLRCPGIAVGDFESAQTPSYALLLVPTVNADAGYSSSYLARGQGNPTTKPNFLTSWTRPGQPTILFEGRQ